MSYHRQGVPVSRAESENTLVILAAVEAYPYMSVREISRLTSILSSTVHRELQNNNLHNYKVGIHQDLRRGDMERRMTFAQTTLETIEEHPDTISRIIFTDEKSFSFHHTPNKQNRRMWSRMNPCEVYTGRTQYQRKINVWAGILNGHLIGLSLIHISEPTRPY